MVALAQLEDYEAVSGQGIGGDADLAARVQRLLGMASAAIERHCNRDFARVVDDDLHVTVTDGTMRLPHGPVESVTSVTDPLGNPVDMAAVTLTRDHLLIGGSARGWLCGTHVVVCTHGYDPIPDDVIAVVCQVVHRVVASPGVGITQETLGDWSASYGGTSTGSVVLTPDDMSALARYRRSTFSVPMAR